MDVFFVVLMIINLCQIRPAEGRVCPNNCKQSAICPDSDCPYGECKTGWWGRKCEFPLECVVGNNYYAYRGTKEVSQYNESCLFWKDYPNTNPPDGRNNASNYCRKADNDETLWCYVTSSNWRHCSFSSCDDQCPPPNLSQHTRVTPSRDGFPVRSNLEVECDVGYRPIGKRSIQCMENKKWNWITPCIDSDECSQPTSCGINAHCQNTLGSYQCSCPTGYTGNPTVSCQDIDECSQPTSCGINAHCQNTPGSYRCSCQTGYTGYPTVSCQDIDECTGRTPCGTNAQCHNTPGSYRCSCPTGYTGYPKVSCRVTCTQPALMPNSYIGNFQHIYAAGDMIRINCDQGYDIHGSQYITCLTNRKWNNPVPTCSDTNECIRPSPCTQNEICRNTEGSYSCLCDTGFKRSWSGYCVDIDECYQQSPCGTNERCINTPGSYKCACRTGYTRAKNASCLHKFSTVRCTGFGTLGKHVHIDDVRDSYEYLHSVTFVCDTGYETYLRTNTTVLTCEHDGNWSTAVPTCKERCPSKCDPQSDCSQSTDHACPYRRCESGWWGRFCQHRHQCLPRDLSHYYGTKNITRSGVVCDRWDKGNYSQPTNDPSPENFCRNADNYPFVWCYIYVATNRQTRSERCDIQSCDKQCEPPDMKIYSFVDDLPTEGFTVGGNITISCKEGYALSGFSTLTCLYSQSIYKWSTDTPVCKEICSTPTPSSHSYIVNANKTYVVGDTVDITCEPGYEIHGNQAIICLSSTIWSHPVPTCAAIRCSGFGKLENKVHIDDVRDSFEYGDTVTFACDSGYETYLRTNITVLTCERDGNWSTMVPTCEDMDECTRMTPCGTNARCRNTQGSYRCSCPTGYTGSPKVSCRAVRCRGFGTLGNKVHIDDVRDSYEYGNNVTFTCDPGYETYLRTNTTVLTCEHDGNWSTVVPTCEASCDPPVARPHSFIVNKDDIYRYSDVIEVECENGYTTSDQKSFVCKDDRSWSGVMPVCLATCELPVTRPHSSIENKGAFYRYGDVIEVVCDSGYDTENHTRFTCQDNRGWNGAMPVCLDIDECHLNTPCGANAECSNTQGGYQCLCPVGYIRNTDASCREPASLASPLTIGLAAGFIFFLVVVIFIVLFVVRRRSARRHHVPTKADSTEMRFIAKTDDPEATISSSAEATHVHPRNDGTSAYSNVPKGDEAANTYCEICPDKPSENAVSKDNFIEYVADSLKDIASLFTEYACLYSGSKNTSTVAMIPENERKNIDKDIHPYDKNRVKLAPWDGEEQSDYINASYINGAAKYRKYIASQGPMDKTIDDFWRMIWEQGVNCVVMLTNVIEDGEKMCEQYWPSQKGSTTFGNIEVTLIEEYVLSGFIRRKMSLLKNGERRALTQFHFTEWPEKGVPLLTSSLVNLRSKILKLPGVKNAPLLVHCSTGVGRTGTFIAFDYLLEQAETTGYIDVTKCVQILREQRMKMVETKEQYVFIHEVVSEALGHRGKHQNSLTGNKRTGDQDCNDEYQNLIIAAGNIAEQHDISDTYESIITGSDQSLVHIYDVLEHKTKGKGKSDSNKAKNIKANRRIVPGSGTGSFQAVHLASLTGNIFITLQTPLSNAVTDFWKLVYEQKTSIIVMLNDLTDESCGIYWPMSHGQVQFGSYSITLTETTQASYGEVSRFLLKTNEENRVVKQYRCAVWPDSSVIPTSTLPIVDLIKTVQDEKDEGPVIVHCMDGATKCGVYCTVAAAMQEMGTEREMDIPQIIERFRQAKPQIIQNLEQFRFCYNVMKEYLNMFGRHQNN